MAALKDDQDKRTEEFVAAREKERSGIHLYLDALLSRLNPTLAAEKAQRRQQEALDFYRRLAKERRDQFTLLQQDKTIEMEALVERQAQQLREQEVRFKEEEARYIRDHMEALRLQAEIEAERRKQQSKFLGKGDDPPPPKLAK